MAERYAKKGKVEIDWRDRALPMDAPDGCGKLLLNLVALTSECLPRGGTVRVTCAREGERLVARAAGEGQGANLREDTAPALARDVEITELTPRNVQAYFTAMLATRLSSALTVEQGTPDRIAFSVAL